MIYCVEDERNIRELIVYTLTASGFEAKGMCSGKELFCALDEQIPELLLLDIMLPGEDGMEILHKLKASPDRKQIPVIMITAKSAEYDKVMGLDGGADDYITKPFGMMEFISRVKAVLRRTSTSPEVTEELCFKALCINTKKHRVTVDAKEIVLTLKEYELLVYLMENKGIVLSRDQILTKVWGYAYVGETRTVDVHVRTLRQKLGTGEDMIQTVRGVGYRIG